MTRLRTFSGLWFDVRRPKVDDDELVAEFWCHVSRTNLSARYVGVTDPTDKNANSAEARGGHSSTFLAFGGDGAIICIAVLVSDVQQRTARVMAFTRDTVTFHGVSWALLTYVLGEARRDGIVTVTSVFSVEDARAIRLERQMGFVEEDYLDHANYRLLKWTLADPSHISSGTTP
jgi:hypothetical protein